MAKSIAAICRHCVYEWRTTRTDEPFDCPRCKKQTGYRRTPKPSKYRNRRVTIDGETFDSYKEASRWMDLVALERAGEITGLKRQVRFSLDVNDVHICDYVADFEWTCRVGSATVRIVEDVKGRRTREYLLKRKLMKAVHAIEVRET